MPAHAAVVFQATHFYAFGGDPIAIEVDVVVFDNYNGDFTKYLWQYTVTNNSFDPDPGTSNGFSGFELALPIPDSSTPPDFGNVSSPFAGWVIDCCSGEPVEWDERVAQGIMPGQQGVFSFTSLPRTPTSSSGWFHTWEFGSQTDVTYYPAGDGPEVPSVLMTSLVDPVPDLVATLSDALQGNVDVSALVSKGRVVTGVASDGVTQVVVKVPATVSGEVLQLTVSDGTSLSQYGSLRSLVNSTGSNSVNVTAVDTSFGPLAFAVYTAPADFVRSAGSDSALASRNINIQVLSLKTGDTNTVPVTIVRPPLALVHGIWSGPGAWANFGLSGDLRFNTFLVNYQSTNSNGFATNAGVVQQVIDQNVMAIKNGMNRQQIKLAAVQIDIVAHSMGGDLARTMVTNAPTYLTANNYMQGLIHKLITIDTPHLGSDFANRLYNSNGLCKAAFGASGKVVGDAVRDLQTTSDMIATTLRQKVYPVETAPIDSVATPSQAATAEANFKNLGWGFAQNVCPSLLPSGGFKAIFGEDTSDLIVSGNSQKAAGLGYSGAAPATTISPGLIHAVDTSLFTLGPDALSNDVQNGSIVGVQTANPQFVINLLNTPIGTSAFSQILP